MTRVDGLKVTLTLWLKANRLLLKLTYLKLEKERLKGLHGQNNVYWGSKLFFETMQQPKLRLRASTVKLQKPETSEMAA